jgi:hypothetical protein
MKIMEVGKKYIRNGGTSEYECVALVCGQAVVIYHPYKNRTELGSFVISPKQWNFYNEVVEPKVHKRYVHWSNSYGRIYVVTDENTIPPPVSVCSGIYLKTDEVSYTETSSTKIP